MRDFLTRNLGLKLLSILFAITLWLFVNLKATEERDIQFPVQWKNLPSFLEITNPVNDFARVRVAGPRRILSNLNPRNYPVVLDLTDAKAGLMDYQITDKMIALIPGLKAEVLPPDTVQFKFDLIVTKEVSVTPNIVGKPPVGYAVETVKADPDRIEVIGAQGELMGLEQVGTSVVDVTDLRKDTTREVMIEVGSPHVRPAVGQGLVKVHVVIEEQNIGIWFRSLPVRVVSEDGVSAAADPPEVDVYLKGLAGKIQEVTAEDLQVFVQFPEGKGTVATVPVEMRPVGDGVEFEIRPPKVLVMEEGGVVVP